MTPKTPLGYPKGYADGLRRGAYLELGDDAPHPGNAENPPEFHAGMNTALGMRGLTLSFFLRVIEKKEEL